MTPERWREVERLYHDALDRPGDERAAFLAEACGGDPGLQREVESLLAYQRKAAGFIETPAADAYPALAAAMAGERSRLPAPSGQFAGRVFGVYEIECLVATGGMGEVYRGLDTRLNRVVAIKTLSGHLSHDPRWRERLTREAHAVSRLNHPHICTLYDIGNEDDVQYLVMEYIEGETLESRLARGRLPLDSAVEYAIQIADALDSAHRAGVVHRDVKPSNVMLTKSGVKVLDFGLATQLTGVLAESPGKLARALTVDGTILGTPQYMSPEQLEGRPADARTDIFALGVVSYEMVTGARAFPAESPAQLIGAILKDAPRPIAEIAPETPWPIAHTISRCLAKAPEDRWQSASDLLFQLRTVSATSGSARAPHRPPARASRLVERTAWIAVVLASIAATWLLARSRGVRGSAASPAASVRFTVAPAAGTTLASSEDVPLALSPEGGPLVYVAAGADGVRRLWLRALDSEHERVLPGTEGANTPFWSPDGQWVGFFAGNSLKKIRPTTGIAQTIASPASTYGGACWSTGDVILFPATTGGLSRVSANGGPVTPATVGESHFWPQFLPDGDHFLHTAVAPAQVMVGSLGSEPHRRLMGFPVRVSALGYAAGHVFYVQDRVLFARPFDEERLEFSGDAVRVLEGVPVVANGRAPFTVSAAGVLAWWPSPLGDSAVLHWFDRHGRSTAMVGSPARYLGFALSPDDRTLAFSRMDASGSGDLWLRNVNPDAGDETQVTFDGASFTPQWSPDGARLLFTGPGEGPPPKMFVRAVSGAGPVRRVGSAGSIPEFASGWVGDSIVSVRIDPVHGNDLWLHRLSRSNEGDTRLSIDTPSNESHGRVSPDGRWLAYTTDASGRDEVWLASFPSGEVRRQVSTAGGTMPQWGGNSGELFYLSLDGRLMAAAMSGAPGTVGAPRSLFQMPRLITDGRLLMPSANNYVPTSDGQRFLAAVVARDPNAPPIGIVVDWPALVKRGGRSPSR